MAIVGKAIGWAGRAVGLMPKTPKLPAPLAPVTRDDARDRVARIEELRRRKGGAADLLTGASGAEPVAGGGKATLG